MAKSILEDALAPSTHESRYPDYWAALGKFIHWFALLESMVLGLLMQLAKVNPPKAQALFSGVRIDQARDLVNRLYDAQQRKRPPELTEAFEHIGLLTKARNDLVHFGAISPDFGKTFVVSNVRQAHIAPKFRRWAIDPALLEDMTHDAQRAWLTLGLCLVGVKNLKQLDLMLTHAGLGAWRYKPPPQPPLESAPPWLHPKPKRQRVASPPSPRKRVRKVPKKG